MKGVAAVEERSDLCETRLVDSEVGDQDTDLVGGTEVVLDEKGGRMVAPGKRRILLEEEEEEGRMVREAGSGLCNPRDRPPIGAAVALDSSQMDARFPDGSLPEAGEHCLLGEVRSDRFLDSKAQEETAACEPGIAAFHMTWQRSAPSKIQ